MKTLMEHSIRLKEIGAELFSISNDISDETTRLNIEKAALKCHLTSVSLHRSVDNALDEAIKAFSK